MAIKIMIIEDDLVIAENLKENLMELGYEVTGVASRYSEAVSLYQSIKPDICLVDIYLKGSAKNGIETIAELNAGLEIPIIYLTSFSDLEFREKAKATNPSAYLMKPASKEQIDVSIDMAMTSFYRNGLVNNQHSVNSETPLIRVSNYFFLRVKNRYEKIYADKIVYLKADGAYCQIITEENVISISANLKSVLAQLEIPRIIRCHRSYAVNINFISAFDEKDVIVICGQRNLEIPLSDTYKSEILSLLPKIKAD